MTLLVQTDVRVKKRKELRRELRTQVLNEAVDAALRDAFAEIDRIQAPLVSVSLGGGRPGADGTGPPAPGSPVALPSYLAGLDGAGVPVPMQPSTPVMLSDSRARAPPHAWQRCTVLGTHACVRTSVMRWCGY